MLNVLKSKDTQADVYIIPDISIEEIINEQEEACDGLDEAQKIQLEKLRAEQKKISDEFKKKTDEKCQALINEAQKEIDKANEDARQIIENAQLTAQQELEKAKEQAELLKQQAAELGYNDGVKKGADYIEVLLQKLSEVIEEVKNDRKTFEAEYEENLSDLSIAIAGKILNTKIKKEPVMMAHLIESAMQQLNHVKQANITLSAKLGKIFEEIEEQVLQSYKDEIQLDIKAKNNLPIGTCQIETNDGILDVGIEQQLKNLQQIFKAID